MSKQVKEKTFERGVSTNGNNNENGNGKASISKETETATDQPETAPNESETLREAESNEEKSLHTLLPPSNPLFQASL